MLVVSPLIVLIENQKLELEKLGLALGVIGERAKINDIEVVGIIFKTNPNKQT